MRYNFELQDIADELLILNKSTIDTLFKFDNCADCIALYIFYYRTIKWQKTNIIKACDTYTRECLKLGKDRLKRAKKILQENGLINIIQRKKKDGKIEGLYIEVLHIPTQECDCVENAKKPIPYHKPDFPQVDKPTGGQTETSALYYSNTINNIRTIDYSNTINNNLKEIEKEKYKKEKEQEKNNTYEEYFETFWKEYPKKVAKVNVKKWFTKNKPNEELFNKIMNGLRKFKNSEDWSKDNGKFIPYPSTWLNQERWEDEIQEQERIGHAIEGGWSL